jgi:hypothetical protein
LPGKYIFFGLEFWTVGKIVATGYNVSDDSYSSFIVLFGDYTAEIKLAKR